MNVQVSSHLVVNGKRGGHRQNKGTHRVKPAPKGKPRFARRDTPTSGTAGAA